MLRTFEFELNTMYHTEEKRKLKRPHIHMKWVGDGSIQHALVKFDWGPSRVSPYEINKQKNI